MNLSMNKVLLTIVGVISLLTINAQEEEFFISGQNDTIVKQRGKSVLKSSSSQVSYSKLLDLPFFDDFARPGIFPTRQLWANENVYINNTFPINPPSLGVATFDALDANGKVYSNASVSTFGADTLTSLPINFSNTPTQSFTLSFYVQPKGNGDMPEENDSLILEFYAPASNSGLLINEISDGWIELFNATDSIINVAEYYLFNDSLKGIKYKIDSLDISFSDFQIPSDGSVETHIPPYGFISIPVNSFKKIEHFNSHIYTLYDKEIKRIDSVFVLDTTVLSKNSYGRSNDGSPSFISIAFPTRGYESSTWERVWSASSNELSSTEFQQISVAVSTSFLRKGFRFRFVNLASLSYDPSHARSEDHWNIDNVYLHSSQEPADYPDIAIRSTNYNFIENYASIPFEHIDSLGEYGINYINYSIKNYDTDPRKIRNKMNVVEKIRGIQKLKVDFEEIDFLGNQGLVDRSLNYSDKLTVYDIFSEQKENYKYKDFEIKYYYEDTKGTSPDHELFRWNDTVRMRQSFYNYYAYDDGSSEGGWGIRGVENAEVAYRFTTLKADTLNSIMMYFNNTMMDEPMVFSLCVWTDNNGKPGELIVKQTGMKPYYDKGINKYTLYEISPESILNDSYKDLIMKGSFFIGWVQPKDYLMNIGVDLNRKCQKKVFYKTGQEWTEAMIANPIMMRPVFDKNTVVLKTKGQVSDFNIYPNPASTSFNIELPEVVDKSKITIVISDICGKKIMQMPYSEIVYPTNLHEGIYLITLEDDASYWKTQKLMINR